MATPISVSSRATIDEPVLVQIPVAIDQLVVVDARSQTGFEQRLVIVWGRIRTMDPVMSMLGVANARFARPLEMST
jgi:hypothetical protein